MLGRFVVPTENVPTVPNNYPLNILDITNNNILEIKTTSHTKIARIGEETNNRTIYIKMSELDLLNDITAHNLRTKIRTNDITPDAIPPTAYIANFIHRCTQHDLPFKATTDLHHPIRCVKPLTYDTCA